MPSAHALALPEDKIKVVHYFVVHKVGIIGAGTMGGGIAMACVNPGFAVLLKETAQTALDTGIETLRKNYLRRVQRGRTPQSVMDQRMAVIQPQLDRRFRKCGLDRRGSR